MKTQNTPDDFAQTAQRLSAQRRASGALLDSREQMNERFLVRQLLIWYLAGGQTEYCPKRDERIPPAVERDLRAQMARIWRPDGNV